MVLFLLVVRHEQLGGSFEGLGAGVGPRSLASQVGLASSARASRSIRRARPPAGWHTRGEGFPDSEPGGFPVLCQYSAVLGQSRSGLNGSPSPLGVAMRTNWNWRAHHRCEHVAHLNQLHRHRFHWSRWLKQQTVKVRRVASPKGLSGPECLNWE